MLCIFAVNSFVQLAPQLLKLPGVEYLLSEVFSQDPLERYFARQRHKGRSNDNPAAHQVPLNAMTLLQQQAVYKDLKTMNVEAAGITVKKGVCRAHQIWCAEAVSTSTPNVECLAHHS